MEIVECFGYTADIFLGTEETQCITEKLVRVNHKKKDYPEVWVDRYDVQLLFDDPTVLWADPYNYDKNNSKSNNDIPPETSLDVERYQDLAHQPLIYFNSPTVPDFLVLSGPTKTTHSRHAGVPTAEAYSSIERYYDISKKSKNYNSEELEKDQENERISEKREYHLMSKGETSMESHTKRRKIFQPKLSGLDPKHLRAFMQEVKERQKTSGLQSRAFWPSFYEHLMIERTASVINALGKDAEEDLREFTMKLKDDDRMNLGFIHRWHSLHPYYRLIQRSRYRHLDHGELIPELRNIFETSPVPYFETMKRKEALNLTVASASISSSINESQKQHRSCNLTEDREDDNLPIRSLLLGYLDDTDVVVSRNQGISRKRVKLDKPKIKATGIRESTEGQNLLDLDASEDEKTFISSKELSKPHPSKSPVGTATSFKSFSVPLISGSTILPRWKKEARDVSVPTQVKNEGVVFLPVEVQIPNMGWDTAESYPGTTTVRRLNEVFEGKTGEEILGADAVYFVVVECKLQLYMLISQKGTRICQEIGYELLRMQDKDLIRFALRILRNPLNSPWRNLGIQPAEWEYLKHVIITVLLRVGTTIVQPLKHPIDSTTDIALKLLKNFRELEINK